MPFKIDTYSELVKTTRPFGKATGVDSDLQNLLKKIKAIQPKIIFCGPRFFGS